MYIEDIVSELIFQKYNWPFGNQITFFSNYELNFLNNIYNQIDKSVGLTDKQAALIIKIFKKYINLLNDIFKLDLTKFLNDPKFKFPKRELSLAKTIKIEESDNIKMIAVSFPYDEKLISVIKNYQNSMYNNNSDWIFIPERQEIFWNHSKKIWYFNLKEEHIIWLMTNLSDFTFDDEFQNYINEISKVQNFMENYAPLVVYEDKYYFKNVDKRIKQPNTNNLIEVLLIARKYGITIWDDNIEKLLESTKINSVTREFLKKSYNDHLILSSIFDINKLSDLINFFDKILIVIPNKLEYEYLKIFHEFLINSKFNSLPATVMFRLDNNTGKPFNDYIRDNNLNASVIDSKFIFVSGKLPKPLLTLEKEIDLVIYFGNGSDHYNLRRYIKNHHNVIIMNLLDNKEPNFADM